MDIKTVTQLAPELKKMVNNLGGILGVMVDSGMAPDVCQVAIDAYCPDGIDAATERVSSMMDELSVFVEVYADLKRLRGIFTRLAESNPDRSKRKWPG